ncbi:MAG TPA: AI-2E family transporter [Gaiellaceae bacterium]|jgi:predicted PurR-regulated permease PerM|nr:AI-2E family transporter [Gaiellaceae bacterium]
MKLPSVPTNLAQAASWIWRLLVCAGGAAVVIALLWYLRVIVLPVMIALTIAPALSPVADWFRRRRVFEKPAAALAMLVGLIVIAALIAVVAVSLVEQFDELAASVSEAVDEIIGQLEDEPFNLSVSSTSDLDDALQKSWREASSYAASGVEAGVGVLTGLVLSVAMLYFILRDGQAFWEGFLKRCAPEVRPAIDRAGRRAWDALSGFVRGTALIAAIDATLIGLGLTLLGVPLAFALSVLVFVGSFVPYVGAFVSGLVAVLVAFADGGWELALATFGLIVAVQFIEGTFLQPVVQSRSVHLHPALVLLAVTAGGSLYGIAGAYLAVPVTAVIVAVMNSLESEESEESATAGEGGEAAAASGEAAT